METSGRFSDIAKKFSRKELPESEVELSGDIPFEEVADYRAQALAHLAEHLELPGFRPGKVPPEMAEKKVGEVAVLEEAVELFVKDFYPELVLEHKVDAVGRPDIRITKLAVNNPIGLTVRATVYPEVVLPKGWDTMHEKVALEPTLPVTDEEVDQAIENLRKHRQASAGKDAPLPELNDEFAKSVGAFETLDALKQQMRKGLEEEKKRAAHDTRRGKIIEALLSEAKLSVPRLFIESELEKIMGQMRDDVQRFGMTFEQYLERSSKTEEGVRNEFRDQAAKRAKLQLLLNKIAEEAAVKADEKTIEHEMAHALQHFPDAKPELLRIHIETVLRNEKALKLLEGEKEEDKKEEKETEEKTEG